jgi:hypothetical protein
VIAHESTLRSGTGIAPAVARQAHLGICNAVWGPGGEVNADKMGI